MIRMSLVFVGLLMMVQGKAQEGYVVPGGAGSRDGSSWENAWGNLETALQSGKPKIAVRFGTYRVERELFVPAGVELKGGYAADGTLQPGGTEQTVLQGAGNSRVIRVKGVLEGVTVCEGRAAGTDGGGIYIENGGTVRNCIVRNNMAGRYYPKVGDVQLLDGSFRPGEQVTAADAPNVRGIVFWINPDPAAPEGKRGWIVAKDVQIGNVNVWGIDGTKVADECVTGVSFVSLKEALADTAGWEHTQEILKAGLRTQCPPVDKCLQYGENKGEPGKWYLPAIGQVACLMGEFVTVNATWCRIEPNSDIYGNIMLSGTIFSSSEANQGENHSLTWAGSVGDLEWGKIVLFSKTFSLGIKRCVAITSF